MVTNCSRDDGGGMALRKVGNHGHAVITIADFLDFVVTELIIWVFGHADTEATAGTAHHCSRDASCHDQQTAGLLCLPAWS